MSAQLVVMRDTNLRDITGTLRALADQIEAGRYGEIHALVWVLAAKNVDVGFAGEAAYAAAAAHLLLHAGAHRLVSNALAGKDQVEEDR